MNRNHVLFQAAKSLFFWSLIAATVVIFFLVVFFVGLCLYPFDAARKAIHPIISTWAKIVLLVCPLMNVELENGERLDRNQTYVLVSNHQSIADIIVALHLNQSFKFIAKKELFLIPIFGWAMMIAGYIPLIRGNQLSGKRAILMAKSYVEQGVSILFFPEGTRSLDGEIHDFKAGAFKLAAETNVPVVPLVIDGTFNFVPKGQRMFNRTVDVKLKVLAPRQPSGTDPASIERLTQEVRQDMIEALNKLRSEKQSRTWIASLSSVACNDNR